MALQSFIRDLLGDPELEKSLVAYAKRSDGSTPE
jgi:hypothetical protein